MNKWYLLFIFGKLALICFYGSMSKKVRVSLMLSEDLYKRCRDAVAALGGPPLYLTLSQFAEDGLQNHLEYLQHKFNNDRPFPEFTGRIKVGRPVGT